MKMTWTALRPGGGGAPYPALPSPDGADRDHEGRQRRLDDAGPDQQASYQSGGHQPWHRSPDLTATAFAAFLGYTAVTQIAQSAVSGGDAHVAVGIKLPDGTISTAAIIHLVLFGSGTYAPWEVVGTDDRTFIVDRPVYGSTARSPVTAGGTVTGVDENIRVLPPRRCG